MSIFVGNISKNVRSRDLDDQFDKFGPCNINYKGSYAFITFESQGDAQDALNELQGKNMGGLKINIEWSRRSGRYDPSASRRPPRRSREQIQCYTCGERGHYARECYQHRYSKGRRPRGRSRSDSYRRSDYRRHERRSPSYSSEERSPQPHYHSKKGRHHKNSYSDQSRDRHYSREGRDRSMSQQQRRDHSRGKRRERQRSREHETSGRDKKHGRDQDRSNSKDHRGAHQRATRSISSEQDRQLSSQERKDNSSRHHSDGKARSPEQNQNHSPVSLENRHDDDDDHNNHDISKINDESKKQGDYDREDKGDSNKVAQKEQENAMDDYDQAKLQKMDEFQPQASDEENDIKAAVVENEGKVGGLDSANGVADGKINEEKELSSPRSAIQDIKASNEQNDTSLIPQEASNQQDQNLIALINQEAEGDIEKYLNSKRVSEIRQMITNRGKKVQGTKKQHFIDQMIKILGYESKKK